MDCKDLLVDGFSRIDDTLRGGLEGLSAEQLVFRPDEQANSIAWLAWHLTRTMDDHVFEIAGRPQAWIADGWHARFGRAADGSDTGYGHSAAEVATIRPSGTQLLLDYFDAVYKPSVQAVAAMSCSDLDRVIDEFTWDRPVTVGVRLISVIADCLQHTGQIGYLRGLILRRG